MPQFKRSSKIEVHGAELDIRALNLGQALSNLGDAEFQVGRQRYSADESNDYMHKFAHLAP